MKNSPLSFALLSVLLVSAASAMPAQAADPTGLWQTKQEDGDRRAHIKVSRCGRTLCNEIVWLSRVTGPDGRPVRDERNRNPRLRSRPILGLTVLLGMREGRDGRWHGRVYSPERGEVFKGHLALVSNDRLKVTGCKTVAFIPVCKSRTWTRVSSE